MDEQAPIDEPLVTLRLWYPVVRFHQLDLNVTEEYADEVMNMNLESKAQFIIDANEEFNTGEMIVSHGNMEAALDVDYATIKRI